MCVEKVKHLIIPVMDHVSLLTSVWLLVLVKMVVHVLLFVALVIIASVPHSILEQTVKVLVFTCAKITKTKCYFCYRNFWIWK